MSISEDELEQVEVEPLPFSGTWKWENEIENKEQSEKIIEHLSGRDTLDSDKTEDLLKKKPEVNADFERLLLGSPDSSYLWISYMALQLKLSEINKAREIGERALKIINYREEQERLNIWVALMNLENNFGTDESMENVLRRALQTCDPKKIYLLLVGIYEKSGKKELAQQTYQIMIKKFSQSSKVWTKMSLFYVKNGDIQASRDLLQRSLKCLPKRKHVKVITKFALMEFKHGEAERGRTIFEGMMSSYPKRVDLWSIYIDMECKVGDLDTVRQAAFPKDHNDEFAGNRIEDMKIYQLLAPLFYFYGSSEALKEDKKVLLADVKTITFYRGKLTTGRRNEPIRQMQCVGGDACHEFVPDVVQCTNVGSDGTGQFCEKSFEMPGSTNILSFQDTNWRCDAELPKSLKFGPITVSCEGYNYPEDPYILRGSCGLEYTLYRTNVRENEGFFQWFNDNPELFEEEHDLVPAMILGAMLLLIVHRHMDFPMVFGQGLDWLVWQAITLAAEIDIEDRGGVNLEVKHIFTLLAHIIYSICRDRVIQETHTSSSPIAESSSMANARGFGVTRRR
ncbi:3364_t:CDS:10 [Acaulospora morrowiae]|uniref:3364_t:CDS:1 n=1 Tax=Acaulospora morrowiae TaxID=94023 RepID=A0A9N9GAW6_9GLOM|nr:3364_t:CDS:10 [Acaulospora morrowiae]